MKTSRNSFQFSVFGFQFFNSKLKTRNSKLLVVLAALFLIAPARDGAQPEPASRASNFTSVEYYDAPHAQQMKSRLSGAEAQPQPDGLLLIKQLKLETFSVDGKPGIVVNAPECLYDTMNGVASSPGHLRVRTGDGKFRVAGEGFLWRQSDEFLTISNHVQTVIENALR
jgi:hypothetical protein